ncbi:amino acid ABC transporter permease [Rhizobium halophytocola]|uniref:Polar amino acid transport system permease protein/cystine transport system permease protein n=1 Tax=Rhizobium halophytocola TaxID=735519 RepID=A0ABS4DUI1_9HYPH|nr:amino acid ABC transporter permease [Rhizobium halophytocola]MBP1849360.1 polar amino acid transport system permease protein/cystine transport system permease protein [Rhizobium halophytocola]
MNFDTAILLDNLPSLIKGIKTTIWLFLAIMTLCTPLALLVALARLSRNRFLRSAGASYVNFIRALPLLVILFFTFYGLPALGVFVSPFVAAMIGLTIVTTAYMAEDMRGALMAIPRGQYEAADALGLTPWRFVRRILIPQALPILCAPYFTRAIVTVKATSIASMVAVGELTSESMAKITETYRSVEFLAFAAVVYLLLSSVLALLQAWVQRRVRLP